MAKLLEFGFNEGTGFTTQNYGTLGDTAAVDPTGFDPSGKTGAGLRSSQTRGAFYSGALSVPGSTTWTMECWLKGSAVTTYKLYVIETSNYYLTIESISGTTTLTVYDGTGAILVTGLTCAYGTPTNWHHVALVRNGTSWTIYVDGVSAVNVTGTPGSGINQLLGFSMGYSDYPGNGAELMIDDVRVYDVALSQAQVQADMDAPVGATRADSLGSLERTYLLSLSADPNKDKLSLPDLRDVAYGDRQWPYLADPSTGRSAADVEAQARRTASSNPLKAQMSLADLRREAWGG